MSKNSPSMARLILGLAATVAFALLCRVFLLFEVAPEANANYAALMFFVVRQLDIVVWAALIMISAAAVGMGVLRCARVRPERIGAMVLLGLGLGLALVYLGSLALGAIGVCGKLTIFFVAQLEIVAWAALILFAALGAGMTMLRWRRLRPRRTGVAALFGLGLGLGLVSFGTLALGAAGIGDRLPLLVMLLGFLIAGRREILQAARDAGRSSLRVRKAPLFQLMLWVVLIVFLLLNLARAYTPPADYDSLEYHAAAPAAYHRAGRVYFMRNNVYANFPQNVAMLHFLGMRLTGSADRGIQVGQMLGAAMGFLAALALYRMLRGIASREIGLIAATLFYTWPGVTDYSGRPFVELPLIFYTILALWGVIWSVRRKRTFPGPRGWVMLAGMACGLAIGVKYTAALLVFIPLLGWLVLTLATRRIPGKEVAVRMALFGAAALVLFSPWALRNTINTRNPVYPLLYKVFDGPNWNAQKDARWTYKHSPGELSVKVFKAQAKNVFLENEHRSSMLLFVFIPFCVLASRRTRMLCVWLAAYAVLLFMFYFFLTLHNARFLDVNTPVLAALCALGIGAAFEIHRVRRLWPVLILLLLIGPSRFFNYQRIRQSLGVAVGGQTMAQYFAREKFSHYANMQYLNDSDGAPPGSKILFLGEAKTFYCRRAHLASTVFDDDPLAEIVNRSTSPGEIRDQLEARQIRQIYIDTSELYRLQTTYRHPYNDREYLGMLDGFNWELFDRFAREHLRVVKTFRGHAAESFPWAQWDAFRTARENKTAKGGHIIALYELR